MKKIFYFILAIILIVFNLQILNLCDWISFTTIMENLLFIVLFSLIIKCMGSFYLKPFILTLIKRGFFSSA